MPRTITLTLPDRPADTLAMFQAMFTPAFLAGILAHAAAQGFALPHPPPPPVQLAQDLAGLEARLTAVEALARTLRLEEPNHA